MTSDDQLPGLLQKAVTEGLITNEQMQQCLAEQSSNLGKSILEILCDQGFLSREQLDKFTKPHDLAFAFEEEEDFLTSEANDLPYVEEHSLTGEENLGGILKGSLELNLKDEEEDFHSSLPQEEPQEPQKQQEKSSLFGDMLPPIVDDIPIKEEFSEVLEKTEVDFEKTEVSVDKLEVLEKTEVSLDAPNAEGFAQETPLKIEPPKKPVEIGFANENQIVINPPSRDLELDFAVESKDDSSFDLETLRSEAQKKEAKPVIKAKPTPQKSSDDFMKSLNPDEDDSPNDAFMRSMNPDESGAKGKKNRTTQIFAKQMSTPFGKASILLHMATQEQVNEALLSQVKENKGKKIGEIMVEKGFLTPQQVKLVMSRQKTKILVCPDCEKRYHIVLYQDGRSYKCKKCKAELLRRKDYKKFRESMVSEQPDEQFQLMGLTQEIEKLPKKRYDTSGLEFREATGGNKVVTTKDLLRKVGMRIPAGAETTQTKMHRVHQASSLDSVKKIAIPVVAIAIVVIVFNSIFGSSSGNTKREKTPEELLIEKTYQKLVSKEVSKNSVSAVKKQILDCEIFLKNHPQNEYSSDIEQRLVQLKKDLLYAQEYQDYAKLKKEVEGKIRVRQFTPALETVKGFLNTIGNEELLTKAEGLKELIAREKLLFLKKEFGKVKRRVNSNINKKDFAKAYEDANAFFLETKKTDIEAEGKSLLDTVLKQSEEHLQSVFSEVDTLAKVKDFDKAVELLRNTTKFQTGAGIESVNKKIKSVRNLQDENHWVITSFEIADDLYPLLISRKYSQAAALIKKSQRKFPQFEEKFDRWYQDIVVMDKYWKALLKGFAKIEKKNYKFYLENGTTLEGVLFRVKGDTLLLSKNRNMRNFKLKDVHLKTIKRIMESQIPLKKTQARLEFLIFLAPWKLNVPFSKTFSKVKNRTFYEQTFALYFWKQAQNSLKSNSLKDIERFLKTISNKLSGAKLFHSKFADGIWEYTRANKDRKRALVKRLLKMLIDHLPDTPAAGKALQELENG